MGHSRALPPRHGDHGAGDPHRGGPQAGVRPMHTSPNAGKRGGAAQGPPIGENIINNIRNK